MPGLKRKKRTAAEIEAEEKEKAQKKQKRDEDKAAKEKQKADEKAEKEARQKERQAEKDAKDAEKQAKAQEREEKRRQKEEKERLAQEQKRKKDESQLKLNAFFPKGPSTPKKSSVFAELEKETPNKPSPLKSTPQKQEPTTLSEYEKRFKQFFVKKGVRMAENPFALDEETREAKSRILDEYISGQRRHDAGNAKFDPVVVLEMPARPLRRGKVHVPVKHIMEKQAKLLQRPEYASAEGQQKVIARVQRQLAKIPFKVLSFREDVRPPYRGTLTLKPFIATQQKIGRVARRPTEHILPLNYDYDSEAEWQDEEGEDIDDPDDDEDDGEDEDDMDGFLDDSEDLGPARPVFTNGIEPESTGLCWEDRKRLGPLAKMYKHRMEFILGTYRPFLYIWSQRNRLLTL
jgi:chromatin assembly factor 1 subunit A